ncbi:MAG: TRAP transporter small permease subunit [Rhodospirillaceae bacterium]|nr:TRAP transporter small permease subunit [Rhodospirillaceae bacterium]
MTAPTPPAKQGRIAYVIDRTADAIAVIGFTGLVFIAFLALADVVLRYGNLPRLPGFKDLTEVAYAVVIASCFPAGLKKGNAVTVRLLGKALGDRGHAWLDVVGALVVLVLFALLAWQFTELTLLYQAAGRTTSTLEWSTAPVWWVVSAMMAVCVAVQAWVLAASLEAAFKGVPRPSHEEHILE